jgi:hypothetical protein
MALKLIGAGLGRTGTVSLKIALEQLGFGPCYHMSELFRNPSRAPLWVQAAQGRSGWDEVLAGYVATVDYPGCSFWRELARFYPTAKILLSVRDAEQWFESTQATIFSPAMTAGLGSSPLGEFFETTVWSRFGDRIHDRDFMVASFRSHNEDVQREIPPERLLVYDVRQGWGPLCQFLGVAVPGSPFPRVNTREEHERMQALVRNESGNAIDPRKLQQTIKERLAAAHQSSGQGNSAE